MKTRTMLFTAALVCMFAIAGSAQTMSSTAELKLACETSPNNVVFLTNNTQISTGPQWPLTETVNTRCTIQVAPNVTFEASQVSMTFSGPLNFQATTEGRALFTESYFIARAVTASLGDKGFLLVERSRLEASAGAVNITAGTESSVDVRGPIVDGGLLAARAITIRANGGKFVGTLTDGTVRAGGSINVTMFGVESQFISTNSTMGTNDGSIVVSGTAEKSLAEFKLGSVATGRNGVNVTLSGNESIINGSQFSFNSPAGGVFLRTGGNKGEVTLGDGSISSGLVTTIQSSITGLEGKAILQNANVNAGSNFRIETGARGNTEAVDSTITAGNLIRIASGAGGNCKSQNNVLTALSLQICQ